ALSCRSWEPGLRMSVDGGPSGPTLPRDVPPEIALYLNYIAMQRNPIFRISTMQSRQRKVAESLPWRAVESAAFAFDGAGAGLATAGGRRPRSHAGRCVEIDRRACTQSCRRAWGRDLGGRIVEHRHFHAAQALDLVAQAGGFLEFEIAGGLLHARLH